MINISNCTGFSSHRSGWAYAISSLKPLHSGAGLYLDGFIEKTFSWQLNSYTKDKNIHKLPYRFPWIGFLHNPHNMPFFLIISIHPNLSWVAKYFKNHLKCVGACLYYPTI